MRLTKKILNSKTDRLYLIDICRGIAAYCIVIFHYRIFYDTNISTSHFVKNQQPFYNILFPAYEFGWIAVQFFFTISGFIFYYLYLKDIYNKKISLVEFFIKRFSRLYPLHFLTLNLVLVLYLVFQLLNLKLFSFSEINIKHYFLNILLISSWGLEDGASFNNPSWSISIEILVYSLFFFIAKNKVKKFYLTFLFILLGIFLFYYNKLIGYGIFCFFIGGLTYLFIKKINDYKIKNINFVLFFLIILMGNIFIIIQYKITGIFFKILILTVFFPSLIIFLFFIQKLNIKIGKRISIIGDISYSIYLIHFPIQIFIFGILGFINLKIDFNYEIIFLTYILIISILSFMSYFCFEKPMQKFLRKNK